jgi:hypothetical protein
MTIVTALSNSCILKAHHHPSTGHRRMTFLGHIASNGTTDNRDRRRAGKTKDQMVTE